MQVAAPTVQVSTAPVLLREDMGTIAVLTFNRPERRNTLSEEMLAALQATLSDIANASSLRAIVLTARGAVFCAGHDLKELIAHRRGVDGGQGYFAHIIELCGDVMQSIIALPQPVIAAVQGTATAAGCQLVATCDLAIASSAAKFCTPGVDIGLFCSTPMVALSRNVASKHAMEMLLTGDMISAERAAAIGLVNRVVAPGAEREEAIELARKIAAKSTFTVKTGKRAFYRQREMMLVDAYRYASQVMVDNMLAQDAQEGICAFIDKRSPKWKDC
jgi:enoyl-CoA hydratase/carnithine racemase